MFVLRARPESTVNRWFAAFTMAVGGWMAGAIYDQVGYYAPAFLVVIAFNVANLMVIGSLTFLQVTVEQPTMSKS